MYITCKMYIFCCSNVNITVFIIYTYLAKEKSLKSDALQSSVN